MRKIVEIAYESIIAYMTLPFLFLICWLTQIHLLKTTSYWFIFWNIIIYYINTSALSGMIRFAIDNHVWAEIIEVVFEALGILVVVQSYINPVIDKTFVDITSLLLPMPAFNWIIILGTIASNKDIEV